MNNEQIAGGSMFSRMAFMLTMCAVLVVTALPLPSAQAQPAAASVIANTTVSGSGNTKSPDVSTYNDQVYLVSTPGNYSSGGNSTVWQKKDSASSVPGGTSLGAASGQADYRSSTTATGPDGAAYVAWMSRGVGIFISRKAPGSSSWGSSVKVVGISSGVYPSLAVSSTGQVFVVWSQDGLARYRYSNNGGASWSGTGTVSSQAPYRIVNAAGGPNGQIVVTFATNKGNVIAGIWNGNSFDVSTVSSGDFLADSSIAIGGDGKIYVAWRNSSGGIYYSQRQSNGSWPSSRIAGGQSFGAVGIAADVGGNIHIGWSSDISSKWDLYYAYKPNGGDFQGPQRVGFGVTLANAAIAASLSTAAYGHVVVERFDGGTPYMQYVAFSSAGTGNVSINNGTPVIEGGATYSNKATLSVELTQIIGSPNQVRYHFGAAPTDADAWVGLSNNTFQVPVPSTAGLTSCTPLVLYTQVRDSGKTNLAVQDAKSATISSIRAVLANVSAMNPNMSNLATTYTPFSTNDSAIDNGGATNGDPNYTRVRQFFLNVSDAGDCSGLKNFAVDTFNAAVPTGGFANVVPLSGDPNVGPKNVSISVTDNAGNTLTYTKVITYDTGDTNPSPTINNTDGLPVLAASSIVTANGANSVLQTLAFSRLTVSDNLYRTANDAANNESFWGLWIANSRTDNDQDNPNLNWYPVQVSQPGSEISLPWSVFSGLNYGTALDKAGDYYVYVRALDGAGNPSVNALKVKVTLQAGYKLPSVSLPLVVR